MLEAHQKDVDFQLLQKANGLLLKWSGRLGIKKKEFLKFCFSFKSRIMEYRSSLPRNLLSQFSKDMKVVSYILEVEESLIVQYTPMVHSIIRKLPIQPDQYEDLVTEGLMAVRSAVWYYREHHKKANFTTFCHCSITKRIKWYRSKAYRKQARRNNKVKMVNSCDLPAEIELDQLTAYNPEMRDPEFDNVIGLIDKIIKACNLNDEELFLIRSYLGRQDKNECWYSEYNRRYLPKTRQGVHYKLNSIQRQMLGVMRGMGVLPDNFRFHKGMKKCWMVNGGG